MAALTKSRREAELDLAIVPSLRLQGPPEESPDAPTLTGAAVRTDAHIGVNARVIAFQSTHAENRKRPGFAARAPSVNAESTDAGQAALASAASVSGLRTPRRGLLARFCSIWRIASVSEILLTEEISRDMRSSAAS